jgi:hypothetical protein
VPGYGIEMVKTIALFPLCGVSNSRLETEKNYALCPMPYALCPMPPSPKDLFSKPYVFEDILVNISTLFRYAEIGWNLAC